MDESTVRTNVTAFLILLFSFILILLFVTIKNFLRSIRTSDYLLNPIKMASACALLSGVQGCLFMIVLGVYIDLYDLGGGFATLGAVLGLPFEFALFAAYGYAITYAMMRMTSKKSLENQSTIVVASKFICLILSSWVTLALFSYISWNLTHSA